ncbi:MAG: hypothetical protein WD824_05030 [Cyclobacteriaceae bacterium]
MMPGKIFYTTLCLAICLLAGSCATYYQKHHDFNSEFEKGDLPRALEVLQQKESLANSKSKFLYFVNNGLLLSILGKYEASNEFFERAYIFGEDYQINYFHEAAGYLTNPNMSIYRGEDHEHLMLLYFKAINFLKMQKPDEALIECRRLNIRLNQLSDKYQSERKYKRDAFIHNLMGIIYQSTGDFNNAFIAYRNALEIYEQDYQTLFSTPMPEQLKKDLLNTSWWTGFTEEFREYQDKFNMQDYVAEKPSAELVFFWHNGLSPVKSEWNINFIIDHRSDNMVVFTNDNLGIAFPFELNEKKEKSDLQSLEVFRVAFPRYDERPEYYRGGILQTDSISIPLELSEDISRIAFHSLKERMVLEFSKGLLRAALKKATELSVKKEDEGLAALIGVVNALTEKADTRNWQTLPHSIYYARLSLHEGQNQVKFTIGAAKAQVDYNFSYNAKKHQTLFHTFSSLETLEVPFRMY